MLADLRAAFLDDLTHSNDLASFIRNFDPNAIFSRNWGNYANAWNSKRDGQVVGKTGNLAKPKTGFELDFVLCDHRTGFNLNHFDVESKVGKCLLQNLRLLFHFLGLLVIRYLIGLG